MNKIYIASKLCHAPRWIEAWSKFPQVHITSRWIFVTSQLGEEPALAKRFWVDDLADVAAADCLICYGEPGENLRGALVEAGAALALGKKVFLIGENENFGTWRHHPLVRQRNWGFDYLMSMISNCSLSVF